MHKLRVLVTGAEGFIGKNLVESLNDSIEVSIITRNSFLNSQMRFGNVIAKHYYSDIRNREEVKHVFKLAQPDVVIHLAAIATVKEDDENPTLISETNIVGTHNLLSCCKPNEFTSKPRFVFASTILADPISFLPGLTKPESVYGATKAAGEALVTAYTHLGKVNGVSLRLVANVGKYATHGLLKDLIAKVKDDRPYIELLGDRPGSIKPYAYVGDTVRAIKQYAFFNEENGTFPLYPQDSVSVEEVAHTVMDFYHKPKEIRWLGEKANWKGDTKRIYMNLGWGWYNEHTKSREAIVHALQDIENTNS